MSSIPISFQKIKVLNYVKSEYVRYLVTISDKGSQWDRSSVFDRKDLEGLRDQLNAILEEATLAEKLNISEELSDTISMANASDPLCAKCDYAMSKDCVTCLSELQSPLERQLFLALRRERIYFKPQYGICRQGQPIYTEGRKFDDPVNNFKDVLTIVDFFIPAKGAKICVYADGFTYHGLTQEQVQHDRNIDEQLKAFGYNVIRFSGKDIREDMQKVICEIKAVIDLKFVL